MKRFNEVSQEVRTSIKFDDRYAGYLSLGLLSKRMRYQLAYGGITMIQQRCDEEGCGPVFCAIAQSNPNVLHSRGNHDQ